MRALLVVQHIQSTNQATDHPQTHHNTHYIYIYPCNNTHRQQRDDGEARNRALKHRRADPRAQETEPAGDGERLQVPQGWGIGGRRAGGGVFGDSAAPPGLAMLAGRAADLGGCRWIWMDRVMRCVWVGGGGTPSRASDPPPPQKKTPTHMQQHTKNTNQPPVPPPPAASPGPSGRAGQSIGPPPNCPRRCPQR